MEDIPDSRSAGSFASWVAPGAGSAHASGHGYNAGSPAPRISYGSSLTYGSGPGSSTETSNGGGVLPTVFSDDLVQGSHGYNESAYRGDGPGGDAAIAMSGHLDRHVRSSGGGALGRGNSRLQRTSHAYAEEDESAYETELAKDAESAVIADGNEDGATDAVDTAAGSASSWPSEPQAMLELLLQQRSQYRAWIGQCAATTLAALDPMYVDGAGGDADKGSEAPTAGSAANGGVPGEAGFPAGSLPPDVPGMVGAMATSAQARHFLTVLKAAAESVRDAGRAASAFHAADMPELPGEAGADPAAEAGCEAAEAEYVSAAYGVTSAVAAAAAQLEYLRAQREALGEALQALPQLSGLEEPLASRLSRTGEGLCRRLREEAATLMAALSWPPPLATGPAGGGSAGAAVSGADGSGGDGGAFRGFQEHPIVARRLVGVLTALVHHQMAVESRAEFMALLGGQGQGGQQGEGSPGEGADAGPPPKPLLWAAEVLAKPIAARLRAHFHPAAPTGRLDRPAWLFRTALAALRQHGHSLSCLDDMLACLGLKPAYNMPAEWARALQGAVLGLLRDTRLPAMLQLGRAADSEGEGGGGGGPDSDSDPGPDPGSLWVSLADAAAAYDAALLPLLGATGGAAEAGAARAEAMLAAAAAAGSRRGPRPADVLDPAAAGTADMHNRYVAVGALAADAAALDAWVAAEGAAAEAAAEAALYDDSGLTPAEEAAARALGAQDDDGAAWSPQPPPWRRDSWPPAAALELAALLDGLVARSRWLGAAPAAQARFLEAAAGRLLGAAAARLGRLAQGGMAAGPGPGHELDAARLRRTVAALCGARHLAEHAASLAATELAHLGAGTGGAAAGADSGAATPSAASVGGGGRGGLWGGTGGGSSASLAAQGTLSAGALSGGGAAARGVGAVPGAGVLGRPLRALRRLHRDGCLRLAREVALGFARASAPYRAAIHSSGQFPFAPEAGDAEAEGGEEAPLSVTPAFAPALHFLQTALCSLSRAADKPTFADVWRGAALAANRLLFNTVATEARFSAQGARQFAADVEGLARVLAPYSRRQGAAAAGVSAGGPLRELRAAARLLCLADADAAAVVRAASAAALREQAAASGQAAAQGAAAALAKGRQQAAHGRAVLTPTKSLPSHPGYPGGDGSGPGRPGDASSARPPHPPDPVLCGCGLGALTPLQILALVDRRL